MIDLESELRRLWAHWQGDPREFARVLSGYVAKGNRAGALIERSITAEPFELAFQRMEAERA